MRTKDFYLCSYYMQFLNHGKNNLSDVKENMHNLVIQDHHLIRKRHMYFLNRLSSKEIYNFLIYLQKKNFIQVEIYAATWRTF